MNDLLKVVVAHDYGLVDIVTSSRLSDDDRRSRRKSILCWSRFHCCRSNICLGCGVVVGGRTDDDILRDLDSRPAATVAAHVETDFNFKVNDLKVLKFVKNQNTFLVFNPMPMQLSRQ